MQAGAPGFEAGSTGADSAPGAPSVEDDEGAAQAASANSIGSAGSLNVYFSESITSQGWQNADKLNLGWAPVMPWWLPNNYYDLESNPQYNLAQSPIERWGSGHGGRLPPARGRPRRRMDVAVATVRRDESADGKQQRSESRRPSRYTAEIGGAMHRVSVRPPYTLTIACMALAGCPAGDVCDGAIFADPADVTVQAYEDPDDFEDALVGFSCLLTVDFDDVDADGDDPVSIDAERYLASHGIRIEGDGEQYVHTDFGLPDDFEDAPSEPNLYAPGPMAEGNDEGGHETTVTFSVGGVGAGVAAFSAMFVDADRPDRGPSGMRILGAGMVELDELMGVESNGGGATFLGFVATDADGRPGPAIRQIDIVNGDEWAGLNESEDVALDDFTFLEPVPD